MTQHLYTADELDKVRNTKGITCRTKFEITCSVCHCNEIKNLQAIKYPFVCQKCNHKAAHNTSEYRARYEAALLDKYGDAHYHNKEQAKATMTALYGGVGRASPLLRNKMDSTMRDKYGVISPMAVSEISDKANHTKKDRYGDEHFNNRPKAIQTCLEKYGVPVSIQADSVKKKVFETKQARYGDPTFNNTAKSRQTLMDKYGVTCTMHIDAVVHKSRARYMYQSIPFDSSYELAYYIWSIDNGRNIVAQPDIKFEYVYDNTVHEYNPDFVVDGKLIEIKGRQFFKDKTASSTMVNPYDHAQDALYEAKHQCMLAHNVEIIVDCSMYVSYINRTYGRGYLQQFRTSKVKK